MEFSMKIVVNDVTKKGAPIEVTMEGDLNPGMIRLIRKIIDDVENKYADTMKLSAEIGNIPIRVDYDGFRKVDE